MTSSPNVIGVHGRAERTDGYVEDPKNRRSEGENEEQQIQAALDRERLYLSLSSSPDARSASRRTRAAASDLRIFVSST
jgi:hypothetical protein